jgi:hypothetical protein
VQLEPLFATLSSPELFGTRRTLPLDGLIWPETGCASIA